MHHRLTEEAHLKELMAAGEWMCQEDDLHISTLEKRAVLLALSLPKPCHWLLIRVDGRQHFSGGILEPAGGEQFPSCCNS